MIVLDLSILNQKGTPMFNSDTLANRPAAGIVGRIFIAIDSPFGIYRDTGTAWDQISGASTFSGSLATGQVAFGSATNTISGTNNLFWNNANNRLGIGTNAPATALDVRTTSGYIVSAFKSQYLQTGYIATGNSEIWMGTGVDGFENALSIGNGVFSVRQNNSQRLQIFNTGNLVLQNGGTFVDAGQRLQVQGTSLFVGNMNITGTLVATSNITSGNKFILPFTGGAIEWTAGQGSITQSASILTYTAIFGHVFNLGDNGSSAISGTRTLHRLTQTFTPASGTCVYTASLIDPIINQLGGANGITRGTYINPTLTSAADWRSIEWSNNTGWGLYGAGTALNYLGGTLGIKTTSPYSPSTFSLDVNGGLLVKNTAGTTAQITLINADPSIGGNNGFLVASVGGTSGGSYVDFQGYYGTSIVGSTALRLNPAGGAVIVNSTTNSGEQFQLTGTLRINGQQSATAGGNSGQHLIINLDGTQYKIKLELP
jgi:hypothetical protein